MKKALVIIVTFLIAATTLVGCSSGKSVDFMQYATVNFSGGNGNGRAALNVDRTSMITGVLGADMTEEERALAYMRNAFALDTGFKFTLDKETGLSNGDTVTVTLTCSDDVLKELKIKPVKTSMTVEVTGLPDLTPLNIFKGLQITVSGVAPTGQIDLKQNNNKNGFISTVRYRAEPSKGLSNGDVVTITAKYNEDTLNSNGFIAESDTMNYTVEGLDAFLASADQLDAKIGCAFQSEAIDYLNEKMVSKFASLYTPFQTSDNGVFRDGDITHTDLVLEAAYFLTAKGNKQDVEHPNILVLVYKTELSVGGRPQEEGHVAIAFYDIVQSADGTVQVDSKHCSTNGSGKTLEAVYEYWVTANKEEYKAAEIPLSIFP